MNDNIFISKDLNRLIIEKLQYIFKDDNHEIFMTELPDGWTSKKPTIITVSSEGQIVNSEAWTRENIRISVYSRDMPTARKILTQVDGALLNPLSLGVLLQVKPGAGIFAFKNSQLGGAGTASATYRVTASKLVTKQLDIKKVL